uniref:Uncharacterized protein n=1 Tax=Arundo donax TaxID=35708 RepID=A0A0A9B0R5_ARUDO
MGSDINGVNVGTCEPCRVISGEVGSGRGSRGSCSIDGRLREGRSVVSSFAEIAEGVSSFNNSELNGGMGKGSTDVAGRCKGVTLYCSEDGHGEHQQ